MAVLSPFGAHLRSNHVGPSCLGLAPSHISHCWGGLALGDWCLLKWRPGPTQVSHFDTHSLSLSWYAFACMAHLLLVMCYTVFYLSFHFTMPCSVPFTIIIKAFNPQMEEDGWAGTWVVKGVAQAKLSTCRPPPPYLNYNLFG